MDFTSSPSFSKSKHERVHDVFINFRGEDTRRKFVSHLYYALSNAGINTFVDEDNLFKGMQPQDLMRAVEGSEIAIVVFSQNYTESTWCLDELVQIIKCNETQGQRVIPVFYEIDPSDVRHQKGDFGKSLEEAARRINSGEQLEHALSRWRRALKEAANFSGLNVRNFRSEAELVRQLVDDVQTFLDYYEVLSITEYPVGLESRAQEVIGLIETRSTHGCMIGIWGMGGSGKTTVAKAVYNQIHRRFMYKSFIENIRETCENHGRGYVPLQEQLLSNVLKTKVDIHSVGMGITLIENRLAGKRALIVLDDVNEYNQLKAVCGNRKWIGQGSVIIVTTRDVSLLNRLEVDYVYEMDKMDEDESLQLFSFHCFGDAKPKEDFSELSRNVVAYCGGLPLALEVLGSHLFDKTSKRVWEGVLSVLEKIPNDEIQRKLRLSFDSLSNDMEKDIFLDVCCFFIGKDIGYVTDILNGCDLCADVGIPVLIERGLIKVEKNNKLGMNPLLREMGREIIRENSRKEPGKHSRLWFHKDVVEVLTKNTGTEAIEGLALKMHLTSRDCFKADSFQKMERLRLLQLDHVQLAGNYGYLSKQLRWISWQGFPSNFLPNNFYMDHVIAIDLKHSHLRFLWKQSPVLKWLKVLNLSHSRYLIETPDFSRLPSLEKLILKDCPSLLAVHKSIGDLRNILLINLKDCTSLSNLPKEIYELKSVKTFILSGCTKIDKLGEDMAQMESLITLVADRTDVKQVPFSIVRSKSIGYISLCGFEGPARDVFPSIIWSWMSPTMNPLLYTHPFYVTSCYLVSMITQNNTFGELAPMLRSLPNLRSVLVQCETESQLSKHLKIILVGDALSFTELGISRHHLRSSLIGVGSYKAFFDILSDRISEELAINEACEVLLPGDNYPYWSTHTGDGHSVYFTVPKDCGMKGMALCIVYFSNPEIKPTECFTSVLIANYTKLTLHIHKQDTVLSFNDEDWQEIISHLEGGDKVEIFVTFSHDLVVVKTAVYLIYGESNDIEIEPTHCESKDIKVKPMHCESNDIEIKPMDCEANDIKIESMNSESNLLEMYGESNDMDMAETGIQGDVFIHFSGDEIRRNFVSHLNSALLQAGVEPSLLAMRMQWEQFVASIKMFQIGIVVLTKEYIESLGCLHELERIIECHKIHGLMVMPVFYEIDPSGAHGQNGDFGNALKATAEEIFTGEYLETGSSPLTEAGKLPKWDESKHNGRNDAELVEEIVKSVLAKLDRALSITKFPVGLEPHVKNVIRLFENQPTEVCMIGIWGIGGSGKTTVAKAIYNQIPYTFGGKSFIHDIREVCETVGRGLVHLQEQLFSDVLKTKGKIERGEMEETMNEIRLSGKRLFIVLDDVNEIDQLKKLCGNGKWFSRGSVVIITTRNLDLLYQFDVDYVYEMDELDESDSVELFSWHAFREAKPKEDFNELARSAVAYCGGLPLALEVLGSYLSKRSDNEWRSVLSKLEIIPNTQVQNILRISFDGLCNEMEKDIFLDVCCFFIGKERNYVTEMLNGCGLRADIGIKVLIERGLIKIEKNNKLGMHHLLRDMGREIVRQTSTMQPGKRSRLWLRKDVLDVLKKNSGTKAIVGLSLNSQLTNSDFFEADAFEKMKMLRFLQLDNVQLTGDYGYLSKQLRWIYWQGFPLEYIPNNFYLEGAIVMDFQRSNLRLVWKEPKVLPLLKILNLSHSKYLTETPDFSKLPSLEKLILKHCPSLRKVHQSIGDLHNLLLINLKGCINLSNLPSEIYKLKSLKTLILSGCLKIGIFTEDTLHMESLITLISEDTAVKQVPISVVSSKSIGYILLDEKKGLLLTDFRSIIWSWMSHTLNPLYHIRPFRGISSSLVSMNMENNDLGDLAPILSSILNLRTVLVQCVTEYQISQVRTILEEIHGVAWSTLKIRPFTPEISNHPLRSYLIEFGGYQEEVFNTLRKSIYEGLAARQTGNVSLPSDNYPHWLAYMDEGHSVYFTVPDNFHMDGMILCVEHLSTVGDPTECLISVLMVNYTKCTIQLFKRDTITSFNDVDWQGMISHLECGDKVGIFVIFGDGFEVQKTAVYLVCDGSIDRM